MLFNSCDIAERASLSAAKAVVEHKNPFDNSVNKLGKIVSTNLNLLNEVEYYNHVFHSFTNIIDE